MGAVGSSVCPEGSAATTLPPSLEPVCDSEEITGPFTQLPHLLVQIQRRLSAAWQPLEQADRCKADIEGWLLKRSQPPGIPFL